MGTRNEKTSAEIAAIASRVLNGGEYTDADVRRLAASCLTQAADRKVAEKKG